MHQVSSSTVSNVLKQYREFNKSDSFIKEVLGEVEFKKNPDISIGNHAIINTQDFEENGNPVEDGQGQKGGPLSRFTKTRNGYGSEIKLETSQPQSQFATPVLTYQRSILNYHPLRQWQQSQQSSMLKNIVLFLNLKMFLNRRLLSQKLGSQ